MTRRYIVLGLAGLLSLCLVGVGRLAAADENVTVTVGKIRTARFRQQVARVRVSSSNREIVKVRYREGFGVQLLGVSPGAATVTVSGEFVRYETGIPERRSGGINGALGNLNHVPLTNNRAFSNTYQVTVVAAPEERERPEPPAEPEIQTVQRRLRMQVGDTLLQSVWMRAQDLGIKYLSGRQEVGVDWKKGRGLEFRAISPGTYLIEVTGKVVRYRNGQPRFVPARYLYTVIISE